MNFIAFPKEAEYNFALAKSYEDAGQLSAAVSFYLRAAEFTTEDIVVYESLIRLALCLERQTNRSYSEKGVLLRAISVLPNRPEAYFLLIRLYEKCKDWHEAYTLACVGNITIYNLGSPLKTDVEYPGSYGFMYEKAVVAWWIGLHDESLALFRELSKRTDLLQIHKDSIANNIAFLEPGYKKLIAYKDEAYYKLKVKFKGADKIVRNYSQMYQDMFVLTMLNGKENGTYLEIGCCDAYFNNNTYLLESKFGWSGISIDIDPKLTTEFATKRGGWVMTGDATTIDYRSLITKDYDYLQLDIEPAINTFKALQKLPLDVRKFAVITFEHDVYIDEDKTIMTKSREYLESFGYVMVVNNISEDKYSPTEDWWVHPDLVDKKLIDKMRCISDSPKRADLYMFGKL
jgi:hypothetical protein